MKTTKVFLLYQEFRLWAQGNQLPVPTFSEYRDGIKGAIESRYARGISPEQYLDEMLFLALTQQENREKARADFDAKWNALPRGEQVALLFNCGCENCMREATWMIEHGAPVPGSGRATMQ